MSIYHESSYWALNIVLATSWLPDVHHWLDSKMSLEDCCQTLYHLRNKTRVTKYIYESFP